jgi:enamine deaminase RidA (YjgF/YER057c/UK114 family)
MGETKLTRVSAPDVYDTTPIGFAPAVILQGGGIVMSNAVGLDQNWQLTGDGGLEAQLRQAARNLLKLFKAAGAERSDIAYVRIFVVALGPDDRKIVNVVLAEELYASSSDHRPATALLGVTGLARAELRVELEGVALVGRA